MWGSSLVVLVAGSVSVNGAEGSCQILVLKGGDYLATSTMEHL